MLIFFKPRIVLFAVEKTATSALQEALKGEADLTFMNVGRKLEKHMGFADYKAHVEPVVLEQVDGPLDYVGVFREPVSWLNSWYRYRLREEDAGTPQSTRGITFEQFTRDYCMKLWARPPHVWINSQSERVCDAEGKLGVNRLFRYDDIPSLIRFLEERLGHPLSVERVNISPEAPQVELSDAARALYCSTFARDFEIYESLLPKAG